MAISRALQLLAAALPIWSVEPSAAATSQSTLGVSTTVVASCLVDTGAPFGTPMVNMQCSSRVSHNDTIVSAASAAPDISALSSVAPAHERTAANTRMMIIVEY